MLIKGTSPNFDNTVRQERLAKKKEPIALDITDEELSLQRMLQRNENKYLMVNLLSRRAVDLKRGTRALVDLRGVHTCLDIAITEAAEGLLKVEEKQVEQKIVNLVEQTP